MATWMALEMLALGSGDKAVENWAAPAGGDAALKGRPVHTCATISRDESLSGRFALKCLVSWKEEL
jgi:hypothetical protein